MGYYYGSGYVLAGYYLVEGKPRPARLAPFLPATTWTAGGIDCCKLSRTYPGYWAFASCKVEEGELKDMQERLGLDDVALQELRGWTEAALAAGHLGWPDAWQDLAGAREFHARYLRAVPEVKLLGLGLPDSYLRECLEYLAAPGPGTRIGLYRALSARRAPAEGGEVRGFDVLGTEGCGLDCSFRCHSHLALVYRDQLHLGFNEYGFIASHGDAKRAADWTNSSGSRAEPVPWFPFLVVEYPLASGG